MIELLVVISIIALLVAIIVPVYKSIARNEKRNACINNLRAIGVALAQYREDYGAYPSAPHPEYLRDAGTNEQFLPFNKQPISVPPGWNQKIYGKACKLTEDAAANDTQFTVDTIANLTNINKVFLFDPSTGNYEDADVANLLTGTSEVVVASGLASPYTTGSLCIPYVNYSSQMPIGNYGLATLYYLFLDDKKDYIKEYQRFHCPALIATAEVDRGANIEKLDDATRTFDPLWATYNTYDVTYNYDQYFELIYEFDKKTGYDRLDASRQLLNPNPPTDTVVCWCYGHRPDPAPPTFVKSQWDAPDYTLDPAQFDNSEEKVQAFARQCERAKASEVDLVLWIDGSVRAITPRLMKKKGTDDYYWVPPFLYASGD